MYRLIFYVPKEKCECVKEAIFNTGAGSYENYIRCSFESDGIGQFQPTEGSNPFIGEKNKLEKVVETKVEMIVKKEIIREAVKALKKAHPYEEPAYSVIKLEDF